MAVPHKQGRANWTEVHLPILTESLSTGTYALSRHHVDEWLQIAPNVTGAWLDYFGGAALASTTALSTGYIHATMVVERTYPEAAPEDRCRYDRYLLVSIHNRGTFQAGPDKQVESRFTELRHHCERRPGWLADLYTYSPSTGW